jgi:uncharacterized membrane protein YeaQ/YmgE (transglycosylase-associated protein family)
VHLQSDNHILNWFRYRVNPIRIRAPLKRKEQFTEQEQHTMGGILVSILIGAIAGWLAGLIMKGKGQGLLVNIIVGIVGGVLGSWLFGILGVQMGAGMISAIISATIGAVLLLFIVGLIKK